MTEPRWHGWATPDQVRQMMQEMYEFLKENQEPCHFMTASVQNAASKRIYGPESEKYIRVAPSVVWEWID